MIIYLYLYLLIYLFIADEAWWGGLAARSNCKPHVYAIFFWMIVCLKRKCFLSCRPVQINFWVSCNSTFPFNPNEIWVHIRNLQENIDMHRSLFHFNIFFDIIIIQKIGRIVWIFVTELVVVPVWR